MHRVGVSRPQSADVDEREVEWDCLSCVGGRDLASNEGKRERIGFCEPILSSWASGSSHGQGQPGGVQTEI